MPDPILLAEARKQLGHLYELATERELVRIKKGREGQPVVLIREDDLEVLRKAARDGRRLRRQAQKA